MRNKSGGTPGNSGPWARDTSRLQDSPCPKCQEPWWGEKRRSLWSGGGRIDTTGAWLVGAKGEYPLHRTFIAPTFSSLRRPTQPPRRRSRSLSRAPRRRLGRPMRQAYRMPRPVAVANRPKIVPALAAVVPLLCPCLGSSHPRRLPEFAPPEPEVSASCIFMPGSGMSVVGGISERTLALVSVTTTSPGRFNVRFIDRSTLLGDLRCTAWVSALTQRTTLTPMAERPPLVHPGRRPVPARFRATTRPRAGSPAPRAGQVKTRPARSRARSGGRARVVQARRIAPAVRPEQTLNGRVPVNDEHAQTRAPGRRSGRAPRAASAGTSTCVERDERRAREARDDHRRADGLGVRDLETAPE